MNIGFAVDGGKGLKVPVIKNADEKEIVAIAHEMEDLVAHYANADIPIASLAGGTFTLTDLSAEGVFSFTR